VRDQLDERAQGLADQTLGQHVLHSGFLRYTEQKVGFAVDRHANIINKSQQQRLRENLKAVAKALIEKTGV
jgi:hypothetical protein